MDLAPIREHKMACTPISLEIYRTAIAMRSFRHAAAGRDVAEAIVARLELSDGRIGWGETLPRSYVTGETLESVENDLRNTLWPAIAHLPIEHRSQLHLPLKDPTGRRIPAACCALDIALADAGFLTDPFAGTAQGCLNRLRASGVVGSDDPRKTARKLALLRLAGLLDFKLKLGFSEQIDLANLLAARRWIGRGVGSGKLTLRVDVNGGWDPQKTLKNMPVLVEHGVCVVEQPVFAPPAELVELARRCDLPLMADESLVSIDDARALLAEPKRIWWNIRLSKNGGILPAMELVKLAQQHGVTWVAGCMVGESGILSAAQRRFLERVAYPPRFVEGNYGKFLLSCDLVCPSVRVGYGGRLKHLAGPGLGVKIDHVALARLGRLVVKLT